MLDPFTVLFAQGAALTGNWMFKTVPFGTFGTLTFCIVQAMLMAVVFPGLDFMCDDTWLKKIS